MQYQCWKSTSEPKHSLGLLVRIHSSNYAYCFYSDQSVNILMGYIDCLQVYDELLMLLLDVSFLMPVKWQWSQASAAADGDAVYLRSSLSFSWLLLRDWRANDAVAAANSSNTSLRWTFFYWSCLYVLLSRLPSVQSTAVAIRTAVNYVR